LLLFRVLDSSFDVQLMASAVRLLCVCRLSSVCNVGAPYAEGLTYRQYFIVE